MSRRVIREVAPNIVHISAGDDGLTVCRRLVKSVSQTYDAELRDVTCPECLEEDRRRHPRAFLSYSSADKDRFVEGFARRLRERGVDVWYADWQLKPGDSLVNKIFDEGLGNADVFIIVVSDESRKSAWVSEELNSAIVKRIEKSCTLIPVILDNTEVPHALKHTVWQVVDDLEHYDDSLDKIVSAIYGLAAESPPLGEPPRYLVGDALPGLQSLDTRILQVAGDLALTRDEVLLDSSDVFNSIASNQLAVDAFLESLEILEGKGLIHIVRTFGRGIEGMSAFTLTTFGLDEFARAFLPDYESTVTGVAALLVNNEGGDDQSIALQLNQPRALVENIIDVFVARGLVHATKTTGPSTFVHWVSPELRRALQR